MTVSVNLYVYMAADSLADALPALIATFAFYIVDRR